MECSFPILNPVLGYDISRLSILSGREGLGRGEWYHGRRQTGRGREIPTLWVLSSNCVEGDLNKLAPADFDFTRGGVMLPTILNLIVFPLV